MNLQEHIRRILREEISQRAKDKLIDMIKTIGINKTAKSVGGLKRLFSILDIKGTKEDIIFLIKSIMENEAKKEFDYCSYRIVPSLNYITLYVFLPKPLPEHEGIWSVDQSVRYRAEELTSMLLSKLGGGLIRGHHIYVYNTGDC